MAGCRGTDPVVCGIAGIFHYRDRMRPVDAALLEAMTRSLAHRGPDGQGLWRQPGIGLGHRRLAIIDLSPAGCQPMADETGNNVITFNGEIYNYRELRAELDAGGFHSRTATDTEVILLGYRAWGIDVVKRLSGIFAFALWDAKQSRLFLARDALGVKPLFYADVGGTFRFGSEIKAILTDPEQPRDIDPEALDAFLTFSYTPAPATGFRRVRQLLPGECAVVEESGMRAWKYWSIPYTDQEPRSFSSAVAEFTGLLDEVVRAQLVSDVPVGAFLSGGLDSAAIVRSMTRARRQGVHALTVGFDVPGFDERSYARQTADCLGVDLHSETVSLDAVHLLPKLSLHMEEPTADSSMLPVYLLCRAARERFTVAISGDGADEILAGYDTYRATALAARYRKLPKIIRRGLIAPLAQRLPIRDGKYSLHQMAVRFTEGAEQGAGRDHASWRIMLTPSLKRRVYNQDFADSVAHADPVGNYAAAIVNPNGKDVLTGLLHADTCFYLPNDMLVKVDRMSMAHGLEVRVPLLDDRVVGFCANLPAAYKLANGKVRKHILRESLRDSLPAEILSRPKSGFNIPVEAWMRGKSRDLLLDSVGRRRDDLSGILKLDMVEALAEEHRKRRADHGHVLFTVMMLALWFENRACAWKPAS